MCATYYAAIASSSSFSFKIDVATPPAPDSTPLPASYSQDATRLFGSPLTSAIPLLCSFASTPFRSTFPSAPHLYSSLAD